MVGTIGLIASPSTLHRIETPFETATFGMGCFWGADALFGATKGVLRTRVGYAAGTKPNPIYKDLGDHVEVIAIDFDPTQISYYNLLGLFWNNHEYGLTTRVKRQYASLILYQNDQQKEVAEKSLEEERANRPTEQIITSIEKLEVFYHAEDYHQKYYLQTHKDLTATLDLDAKLLLTSHAAARLNGYLVGVGGVQQFFEDAAYLGLSESQTEYVHHYVEKNEGGSLFC